MGNDAFNPVTVEEHIRKTADRIAKSAAVCDERLVAYMTADRDYDREYAKAFLAHRGAQTEKRYAAELETTELREIRDVADAAYRYADRLSKALQAELMAYQSINKSVIAAYNTQGRYG